MTIVGGEEGLLQQQQAQEQGEPTRIYDVTSALKSRHIEITYRIAFNHFAKVTVKSENNNNNYYDNLRHLGTEVDDKDLAAIIAQVRREQAAAEKDFNSDYDRISDEAFGVLDNIRASYIPERFEALHREQPKLREKGIKNQIVYSLVDIYPDMANDPYLHTWTIKK
ncbi:MAG TPA: hypothetical protein VE504_07280 [Nitrososphaeraceae archaeon]|nr:hypothetical protein [Nitrososphaeraceae archaeon]